MENWANTEKAIEQYGDRLLELYKQKLSSKGYRLSSNITAEYRWMGFKYQAVFILPEYWKWVEYGRKPGKMPPVGSILKWINAKGIKPLNKSIPQKSLAFAIAKSIGKKGNKPKPFLRASKEQLGNPADLIRKAMEKDAIKQIKERK